MKTFTLRLDDTQAEALERLAAIKGKSKNVLINELIATEYNAWDYYSLWYDGIVVNITSDEDLYAIVRQRAEEILNSEITPSTSKEYIREVIATTLRTFDYSANKVLESGSEAKAARIAEEKEAFINDYLVEISESQC